MSNHSPEAIAAFPDPEFPDTDELDCGLTFAEVLHFQRDAFDDGAASKVARQYAVTREALWLVFEESWTRDTDSAGWVFDQKVALDALLSVSGPLLDAADVWDAGQKSGMRHTDRMRAAYEIGRPELPGPPSSNPYRKASA